MKQHPLIDILKKLLALIFAIAIVGTVIISLFGMAVLIADSNGWLRITEDDEMAMRHTYGIPMFMTKELSTSSAYMDWCATNGIDYRTGLKTK